MTFTSTSHTMSSALDRAHENGNRVALLVDNHWIHGHVLRIDGHGVVLHSHDNEHSVVKMERSSAVRLMPAPPTPTPIPVAALPPSTT